MAKKSKNKPTTINNIESVNLEIDYDKLAEAIVNAEEKTIIDNGNEKTEKINSTKFFDTIKNIIFNKNESDGTLISTLLAKLLSYIFNLSAFFNLIISVSIGYNLFFEIKSLIKDSDTIKQSGLNCLVYLFMLLITVSLIIIFRAIGNDIQKEKDRNFIISLSSLVIAFVAMVISIITYIVSVKGIGIIL